MRATREVARTFERPGIDAITFNRKARPAEATTINRREAGYLAAPAERLEESETIHKSRLHERIFGVVSPSFTGDYVWRLSDGESRFSAMMEDKAFLERVERGDIGFTSGSLIQVEVETIAGRTPTGKLSSKTTINKVLRVIPPPKQPSLNFESDGK